MCIRDRPCQAPWTRMKVCVTRAECTGREGTAHASFPGFPSPAPLSVAEHAARGGEGARGELVQRPGALRLVQCLDAPGPVVHRAQPVHEAAHVELAFTAEKAVT